MHRRNHWVAAGLIVVGLGLTGCGTTKADYGEVSQAGPAKVEPVKGTDLNRVTLTSDAASKLGVQTAPVEAGVAPASTDGAGAAPETTVPASAVIYDKDGNTWVYVVTRALTYERQAVGIARIDGDTAVLRSGPAPGTRVVTVGAQELLGAELGVAGE
ncbi:MAG: hypothetical protein QOE72_1311 [Chloroflexota bacterium]|jgi:hypothetical protein|nr:hypothetical protein [Chloroflexota bacterium]